MTKIRSSQFVVDGDIDYNGKKIKKGGFESLSANPTALSVGQTYWNSVDGRTYAWTGSAWTNDAKTLEGYNSQKFLPFNISGYSAPFPLGVLIETDISAPSVFYLKISGLNYVSPYLPIDITLQGYMSNSTTLAGVKAYTNGSSITNFSAFIYNGKLAFWGVVVDTNKTLFVECYHHDTNYNRIISVKNSAKPTTNIAADTTVTYITAWSSNNLTPSNFSNASDSMNFTISAEPTSTGTSTQTHLYGIQYLLKGLQWLYTNWKSLFSETSGSRIQLSKMQHQQPYINGNSVIGVNTDTIMNLVAGTNVSITPGTPANGILPVTIAATGGGGGSQVQVDFNITDSADVRYILNKPIDNRTISARISALVNKRFQVNPGTAAGSYNEGIRVANASNGYSLLAFGCDPSSDSGLNSDGNQWHAIKYPNGDFAIVKNSSDTSQGLYLDFDGSAYWKGTKIVTGTGLSTSVVVLDPTIVDHHLTENYYQLPFDQYNANKNFAISLDETNVRYIELSVQMSKVDTSSLVLSFAAANSGEVYFTKNIVDITTTSGTCMVHYTCKLIEGNWFVSNEVFEM